MIVTCTSCKTRLRVSEDKIGPKGARVRCNRCSAVFVIPPEATEAVAADPLHTPDRGLEQPQPPTGASNASADSDLDVSEEGFGSRPPGPPTMADPFQRAAFSAPATDPFQPRAAVSTPATDPFQPRAAVSTPAADPFQARPAVSAPAADPFQPQPASSGSSGDALQPDLLGPASVPDVLAGTSAPSASLAGSPLAGSAGDPFALDDAAASAAAPRKADDPFASGPGWDPFGVGEPGLPAVADGQSPFPGTSTGEADAGKREEPAAAPSDLASLALEEREAPRPTAEASPGRAEEDLVFGATDLLSSSGDGGLLSSAYSSAATLSTSGDTADFEAQAPPLGPGDPAPISVARSPIPTAAGGAANRDPEPLPGASEAEHAGAPAPGERRGRVAVAMTNSFSLALLIAVAVAIFFSWRSGLVGRVRGALARTTPSALEASGVTGGLYDTASGSPVLVVRGRIGAHAEVKGPVRVRVDLVDGARVVASAAGLAGAGATPEQVYGAGTPEQAGALRTALDARTATRLGAGDSVPFLVVFPPPAPDPRGLTLRVEAEPEPAASSTHG